jgi:hypothetical protein
VPKQDATPTVDQLHGNLKEVRKWVDSLKGMRVGQVRGLFGTTKAEESTWRHANESGILLRYKYPDYEIELYCSDDRVVMVSIELVLYQLP